ncbi:Genome sequencing data, contig C291 [Microcystis aeruginosa PCC 9432]|jgi:spoIIIJ-associated protein|uniref:Genome sequencing data, contig C291 n=1 Tax=Microcystis aeruginosa PCC 9432 TaxID=1160280 RepID=A0A822L7S0_MICAE|nr:R3H domain-containing nucleic acid-binding protein [Microcystis aeruginosa]MDB9397808.1 RNA-binding protein [Microcystis aeruginosa CS-573]TRU02187.1 MAG: RNA-binding protein [Microcystis aeruginosa Ma_OC_LR_19540900_S633]CCH91053.1 Genome sequencing data, contig C291 [Microcystis aeruginosa PCC 9432]
MSIWEQNSEKAKQWLEKLLKLMAMPTDVQIGVQELGTRPSSCWLIIDSSQLSPQQVELLLANKGEGLDAIQSLANTILNIGVESTEHQFYIVEINGYRQQRQSELFDWVNQAATQVRQTGQEIELKALSSAERRQIHAFFQEENDLTTESRGVEPDRRLVIRLK